eukprot:TRINITY_DN12020_c0_g1_i2.p1 TRINITY_DN12020_c0_g1~~TRINITY_DN12020_c0_g1_i2.p1  ORF type:complete len:152 (+),score=32.64 TRINITY_DN12020_c0_g1_i2:44-457(+)
MCIRDSNLSSNNIGDNGADAITSAIKSNQALATLDLENNKIEERGLKLITTALQSNTTLTTLNVDLNKISDKNSTAFATALKLSLIHISEPTRPLYISYAVFCLKKKKKKNEKPNQLIQQHKTLSIFHNERPFSTTT